MTNPNYIHTSIEWAKNRLDEMNASVTYFEGRVLDLQSEVGSQSDAAVIKMRSNRDAFKKWANENQEVAEEIQAGLKEKLEAEWADFEDNITAYFDAAADIYGKDEAYIKMRIDAQKQAWDETVDRVKTQAKTFQAKSKIKVDAAIAGLEEASQISVARLDDLNKAGRTSWAALRDALMESRNAVDKAMGETHSALKDEFKATEQA